MSDKLKPARPGATHVVFAKRIAIIYALATAAWIVGSDLVVYVATGETHSMAASIAKGLLFAVISAALLYALIARSLRSEEMFIGAVLDSLPGVFYVIDAEGRFLHWNSNFEIASGYSFAEISRMDPTDLFSGADKARIADKIRSVFVTGEATAEADFLAKDQTRTPYFFTGRLVRIDRKPCLIGMGIDIAARKRAEATLRESEEQHRATAESVSDVILVIDAESRIRFVNPAVAPMFGFDRDELLGEPLTKLMPEEMRALHLGGLKRYTETGQRTRNWKSLELRGKHRDGREFPIEVSFGEFVREGKPAFTGVIRDITERKLAERELQQFRMAMDVSADSVYLTDLATMRFVYLNNEACKRLGYTREQLLQLGPQDVIRMDPEQARREFEEVANAGDLGTTNEHRFVRSDGGEGWTELHRRALRTDRGTLIVSIGRDTTERKQADERIRRLNRIYAVLSGINSAIVRATDRTKILEEACRIAVEHGGFGIAQVLLVDEDKLEIWSGPSAGIDGLPAVRGSIRPGAETISEQGTTYRAIRERKPVFVNDITDEPAIDAVRAEALQRDYRSVVSLPLIVGEQVVAVLVLCAREKNFFDEEELRLLDELAGDIAFSLDTIEKKEKLDYLAFYDQLTGMANRALFLERVGQSIRTARQAGGKFALAILDIERLGTINESLGRQAGDALLKLVAERLKTGGGPSDTGRIGANHFALVMGAVKGRSEAGRTVGEALRKYFGESFRVNDTELRLAAKAGVALFPGDGATAETLLENAEAALGKAKELGERYVLYTAALVKRSVGQLTLENQLRQALEKNELVLHYQPKVDLEMRRIVGVEALIRWQSPELGLVPPGKFIPLMEETGLILQAGAWALRQAAADHRKWAEQGLQAPRVAVNVSAIQLRQRDFVTAVEQAIVEGVAPTGIDVEITESLIMEDIEGTIEKLKAVRGLGVTIAIDDFGTGYSSLGYLAKLPVQVLKIDRSFVTAMLKDPDTMTLVSMMISLAHSLKLKVVAEGVEEEEQAKMLRLLRCDQMQGYLFSKPVPFEQMTALLTRESKA